MDSITHQLQENEGLVCGTCGDEGFTNAFVYCVKCLDVAIHRYCLDEMPKTFYEHVIWCCEHCQVKSSQSRKEEPAIARHVKVTHINKKRKKERDIVSLIAVTKEVTSQRHIKEHAHNIRKKAFTKRKKNAARLAAKKKEYKLRNDLENGIPESCTMVDVPISYTPSKMKHKELISDSSFMEEESAKNTDHECRAGTGTNVFQSADIENNIQDNYYICAQPVRDTVWRGSFTVIGAKNDFSGSIFAHISTKACDKVFQEANMMPSLLHLEMHPKIFLWPESFQEREPSDDSIALYFFPGDPINEKIFDHFVQDMMDKELAMRAPTKNAELLIFTSMVLPHCFQKFRGMYYLWGVFRGKRDDPTSVVSHNLTVPNSSDQCALLKRVDVAVQPFVEHVDNPIGQPTLCEGSEHIPNSTDQFALSKRVDVVEPFVEHVHDAMGQLISSEGSENIPNSSEIDVIMKLYVDDAMGQPILYDGSEHI
uniref:Zinc finger, FYVE/PHD-type n=1 Tax=Tanacetum cinerariifolium TaxID=118510 RepID=A0A6L2KNQ0_TANCI|nr:zinc finger, FYVE/PHD-type [Tanacetum cinerariifolium]